METEGRRQRQQGEEEIRGEEGRGNGGPLTLTLI